MLITSSTVNIKWGPWNFETIFQYIVFQKVTLLSNVSQTVRQKMMNAHSWILLISVPHDWAIWFTSFWNRPVIQTLLQAESTFLHTEAYRIYSSLSFPWSWNYKCVGSYTVPYRWQTSHRTNVCILLNYLGLNAPSWVKFNCRLTLTTVHWPIFQHCYWLRCHMTRHCQDDVTELN